MTECATRYKNLSDVLECLRADVMDENIVLPYADIVIKFTGVIHFALVN